MLAELEKLLKQGQVKEVHAVLDQIAPSKVPREQVLGLANVARRAGFHRLAFKILTPVIRPKNKLTSVKPTPEERCEYGMILYRLGMINEARKILSSPGSGNCSLHKLYLAFTYFSEWNYEKAKELLEDFINQAKSDPYSLLLGKINLAQAYFVIEQFDQGLHLISDVIETCRTNNYKIVLANAFQNLADLYAHLGDKEKAKSYLKDLEELIGNAHYRYNLYAKRVLAETELPNLNLLNEVRLEARQKCQFELARECDLMEALTTRNQALLLKVFFGTPYAPYRARILKQWKVPITIPSSYLWEVNPEKPSKIVFDVLEGSIEGTQTQIKRGSSVHRLIQVFAGNMYKSYKIEALFSLLFPNDLLPVNLSAYKAHNVISRTRKWLLDEKIPFTIGEEHGEYFLKSETGCKLKIPSNIENTKTVSSEQFRHLRLTLAGANQFVVNDVARALKISKASANRVLKEALESGAIERFGSGRSTTYRFVA